jgi:hypothetical protein
VPWSRKEAEAFSLFHTPNELARALSSPQAGLRQQAVNAMQSIQHVRDSFYNWFEDDTYFRSRLDDILFIGFQEQLNSDFEELTQVLGLPEHVRLPSDDKAAHRNPSTLDKRLDDVALANLRSWYAADLQFYQLCKSARDRLSHHRAAAASGTNALAVQDV